MVLLTVDAQLLPARMKQTTMLFELKSFWVSSKGLFWLCKKVESQVDIFSFVVWSELGSGGSGGAIIKQPCGFPTHSQ